MTNYLILSLITVLLIVPGVVFGENIPEWIKNNAKWWSENKIDDSTFLNGIKYLIENNIIKVQSHTIEKNDSNEIPEWIKNNAKWWSENKIDDSTFLNGIKYLIENQMISINEKSEFKKINTDLISNYFKVWVYQKDIYLEEGIPVARNFHFELKNEFNQLYKEIGMSNETKKVVVIKPIFTSSAYENNGFYDFYLGKCDKCITTKFSEENELKLSVGSQIGKNVLNVLGYQIISDIEIDKKPEILNNFDKVIVLHNEYVTQKEFDAITNHPNVIYLYPNSLYAKISVNYQDNTMTLIRGHNYPSSDVLNGFNWKFDNSPMEYNEKCNNWDFYQITNGWMLNCYPERIIASDIELLKTIKKLGN